MKAESDPSVMDDQLAKSKSEIVHMFLEETENLRDSYLEMEESEISEPTKKEAVLASLQSLRLSIVKRSVGFLNPQSLFVEPLMQYVTDLGAAIDTIEASYIRTEEADIDEPTKKEAVLHPLNILWNDINEEVGNIK
jgi:hypothetical protein